ncbi:uncharacterized protein [Dermacentor albipictus]|uniref:uncharacterized protein isoform X1 n=2 Tax=Dermacentor albipictus TaxID=60249 RepID=UPI0031FDE5CA
MSSQSSLSGSSSSDYGGMDLHEALERHRRMTMENIEQLETTVKYEKYREETETKELSRTCDTLSPIPEAPDNTEMPVQELEKCTAIGFALAEKCRPEEKLGEAVQACKIFRQRAQALLAEAAELTRLAEQAAETDSDDEPGSAGTSKS